VCVVLKMMTAAGNDNNADDDPVLPPELWQIVFRKVSTERLVDLWMVANDYAKETSLGCVLEQRSQQLQPTFYERWLLQQQGGLSVAPTSSTQTATTPSAPIDAFVHLQLSALCQECGRRKASWGLCVDCWFDAESESVTDAFWQQEHNDNGEISCADCYDRDNDDYYNSYCTFTEASSSRSDSRGIDDTVMQQMARLPALRAAAAKTTATSAAVTTVYRGRLDVVDYTIEATTMPRDGSLHIRVTTDDGMHMCQNAFYYSQSTPDTIYVIERSSIGYSMALVLILYNWGDASTEDNTITLNHDFYYGRNSDDDSTTTNVTLRQVRML